MQHAQILLLGAVALFGAYLIIRFRPGATHRRKLQRAVTDARARAHAARTPEARSEALCDAGIAASKRKRWTAALGYFLRAMRASPTSPEIINRAAACLAPRPDLAESVLWRRISALPDDDEHHDAFVATLRALTMLYEGPLRDRGRAKVLRRLVNFERAREAGHATSGTITS
jgi:hypothetical protein